MSNRFCIFAVSLSAISRAIAGSLIIAFIDLYHFFGCFSSTSTPSQPSVMQSAYMQTLLAMIALFIHAASVTFNSDFNLLNLLSRSGARATSTKL